MKTCRDCGQTHDDFLGSVACDIRHHGVDQTRQRLLRFCTLAVAANLIERAQS